VAPPIKAVTFDFWNTIACEPGTMAGKAEFVVDSHRELPDLIARIAGPVGRQLDVVPNQVVPK
jgi:hypothetical protein